MTQVLSDHSEAIEGFSLMINNLERETVARSAIDFIKEFKRTVERNRDGLQEYERESSELLSRSKVRSIAFDVALERPSKAFDDYLAIKFSLESMVKEGEDKEKGFGVSLLSKLTSLFVYLNFRNSLNGEATGLINISRKSSQDAATNTHYDGGEAYSVWLGTLEQRAEMARQITDPTAIIPLGWLVNTLPNVFFLEFSLEHKVLGTVLIETNPAIAPVMSANFALLCDKSRSCSYLNCVVFQCWKDESIITGDNETDKGTGGRSVLNGDFLVPDDTGLKPFRGAVGMRRLKKRISEEGKISSQFRITLQEVNKITAIFGRVVKGIEVVDRISRYGDRNGNPKRVITITDCGKI